MNIKEQPGWFKRALTVPYKDKTVICDGVDIHYLLWSDDTTKPGLVLVHGNGAHAHWWTFLAPFFMDHYQILAIDLSGAGDSGRRSRYTTEAFAAEINAAADDAGFGNDTIIVGHSFVFVRYCQGAFEPPWLFFDIHKFDL